MASAGYYWVVLFLALLCLAPWGIKALQKKAWLRAPAGASSRVVSTIAIGPQQRVVSVEVGPDHERTVLVLGVTPQQIHCLHHYPAAAAAPSAIVAADAATPLRFDAALKAQGPLP